MPRFLQVFRLPSRSKEEKAGREPTPSLKVDTTSTPRQTDAIETPIKSSPAPEAQSPVASTAQSSTVSPVVEPHSATSVQPSSREASDRDSSGDAPSSSSRRRVRFSEEVSTGIAASPSTYASSSSVRSPIDSPASDASPYNPPLPYTEWKSLPINGSPCPPLWRYTDHHRWEVLIGKVLANVRHMLSEHKFTFPFIDLCSTSPEENLATERTLVLAIVLQPSDMMRYKNAELNIIRLCALYWTPAGSPPIRFWEHNSGRKDKRLHRALEPTVARPESLRPARTVSFVGVEDVEGRVGEDTSSAGVAARESDAAGPSAVPS